MRSRIIGGAAFAVVVAAVISACGGGSTTPSPTSPTPNAATTISIMGQRGNQSFSPNPAAVSQGSALAWRNTDNTTHHIVMNDGSLDTGDIGPGATSTAMALMTNGANYHCTIHPTMVGSINMATGEPPPCTGAYC
jgi:plastocyanin